MNIFYLDIDPRKAAEYHCDQHVVKMILETAQLLSTAHHVCNPEAPYLAELYKPTHVNHPCAVWVRTAQSNYEWTVALFHGLLLEYFYRYGKFHSAERLYPTLKLCPDIAERGPTPIPQCMPEVYRQPSAVEAYRSYYIGEKHFAKWEHGTPEPYWRKQNDPTHHLGR